MKCQGWLMLGFSWLALTGCQTVKNRLDSPNRLSSANNRPTITRNEVSHQNRKIEWANSTNATRPDTNLDAEIATVAYRPQLDDNLSPVRLEPPTPDGQASAITEPPSNLESTDADVGNERSAAEIDLNALRSGDFLGLAEGLEFDSPALPRLLSLADVLASVEASYPLLRVAFAEQQIAAGKEVSAWGEFDLTAKAYSISAPLGFYKTYRSLVELNQPMYAGGYVYSGYKIGDGKFQPWFKERETNEGGEFSAGFGVPLLKNRAIDNRRSEVMQAALARQATQPFTQAQLLLFNQEAAYSYWSWVAAGRSTRAAEALVDLGLQRVEQVKELVAAGDLAPIADIDNQRLIADRETKLIETARKFQASAIKLSLFLRDATGQPIIAELGQVPDDVPPLTEIDAAQLEADISSAIAARPEIAEIDFEIRRVRVQIAEANNSMLPKLDAAVGAAQDVGNSTNSIGDKTPFELEAGLYGEVPLQRREARGKRMAANAKLRQLCAKREFIVNKVTVAVQDAHSALQAAEMRIERAELNANLAEQSLQLARDRFNAGDIDLIVLNIYEKAVTDAQLVVIEAESDYFKAVADYRAALAQPAGSETN